MLSPISTAFDLHLAVSATVQYNVVATYTSSQSAYCIFSAGLIPLLCQPRTSVEKRVCRFASHIAMRRYESFNLIARITLDDKDYKKGINSAEKSGKSFGKTLTSGLKVAGKAMAALYTGTVAVAAGDCKNSSKLP